MNNSDDLYMELISFSFLNLSGNIFGMNLPPKMWNRPLKCLAHSFGAVKLINISGCKSDDFSAVQPVGQSTEIIGTFDAIILFRHESYGYLRCPLKPKPVNCND